MLNIIKERTKEMVTEYYIEFNYIDDPNSGFRFPANEDGTIALDKMNAAAKANYENCLTDDRFCSAKFTTNTYTYTEPAVGKCTCGSEVTLTGSYLGADQCICGRWYNLFGQELKDPKYWEEDYEY